MALLSVVVGFATLSKMHCKNECVCESVAKPTTVAFNWIFVDAFSVAVGILNLSHRCSRLVLHRVRSVSFFSLCTCREPLAMW